MVQFPAQSKCSVNTGKKRKKRTRRAGKKRVEIKKEDI